MELSYLCVLCMSFLLFHAHFSLARGGGRGGSSGRSSGSKRVSTSHQGSTHTKSDTSHSSRDQGSTSQGRQPKQPGPSSPGNPTEHKIFNPQSGRSFDYEDRRFQHSSPFSRSVSSRGVFPSDKSKGYAPSAAQAAASGGVVGMALGYSMGHVTRPHFQFRSPQEEYYYNRYTHKKQTVSESSKTESTKTGSTKTESTKTISNSRDGGRPPQTYENYMDSCMKRTDLLSEPKNKTAATNTTTNTTTNATISAPDPGNNTAADNSSAPSTPRPTNQIETGDDEGNDTVSIVEIGYPALIEQMKVRRCLELYMTFSEKYSSAVGGVQGLEMGPQGLLAVVTSTILMLLNSNIVILLHTGPY